VFEVYSMRRRVIRSYTRRIYPPGV
jgi:hypothetical protein